MRPLVDLQRRPIGDVLKDLKASSEGTSKEAGQRLIKQAAEFGLGLRDYLTLAVDVRSGKHAEVIMR